MTIHLTEEEFNTIMLRAARFCSLPIPYLRSGSGPFRVFVRGEKFASFHKGEPT